MRVPTSAAGTATAGTALACVTRATRATTALWKSHAATTVTAGVFATEAGASAFLALKGLRAKHRPGALTAALATDCAFMANAFAMHFMPARTAPRRHIALRVAPMACAEATTCVLANLGGRESIVQRKLSAMAPVATLIMAIAI